MYSNLEKLLHYMFLCHRRPDRSFFYKGKQFPICARCTGILAGYFIGIFYLFFIPNRNHLIEILFMLPLIIDGTVQYFGKWESTNMRRVCTGILAGISTVCLFSIAGAYGYNHGKHMADILIKLLQK